MLNRLRTFYCGFVVCGLLACNKNPENATLGFDQESHQEIIDKPCQIGRTSVQNPSKNDPKSIKLCPWSAFGAKSRPGRLQVGPTPKNYCSVGAVLAENGAQGSIFGPLENPKSLQNLTFEYRRALWTSKNLKNGVC